MTILAVERLREVCERYGVARLEVFGSVSRGEAGPDSDVDRLREDALRRDAVLWNFMVLGEAANQLSDEIKDEHGEIEWSKPIQLRNKIVHGYWDVSFHILHDTAA